VKNTLAQHNDRVSKVAFSPSGTLVASSAADESLSVWDTAGQLLYNLPNVPRTPRFEFSRDGKFLIVAAKKTSQIKILDPSTGKPIKELVDGHEGGIISWAISPDGTRFFSTCNTCINLRNVSTWEIIRGASSLKGEKSCSFSADGKHIYFQIANTLHVWDSTTGETVKDFPHHFQSLLYFSPDYQNLFAFTGTSLIPFTKTWEPAAPWKILPFVASRVVAFHPPTSTFAVAPHRAQQDESEVLVWRGGAQVAALRGHGPVVTGLLFHHDELWSFANNELFCWDAKDGYKLVHKFYLPLSVNCVARHGNLLVCGTTKGVMYFFVIQ